MPADLTRSFGGDFRQWGHGRYSITHPSSSGGGADPTGVVDATDAILAARAAAIAYGSGEIILPPGTFLYSDEVEIPTGARMRGYGRQASVLRAGHADARLVLTGQATVTEIQIDGDNVGDHGIVLQAAARSLVQGVICNDHAVSGFEFDLTFGGRAAGSNNMAQLHACLSSRNGVGYRNPTRQADNNGLMFIGCVGGDNVAQGMLGKGIGWQVQGGNYFSNGGYGIQFGETTDLVGPITENLLIGVWMESNAGAGWACFGTATTNGSIMCTGQQFHRAGASVNLNNFEIRSGSNGRWSFESADGRQIRTRSNLLELVAGQSANTNLDLILQPLGTGLVDVRGGILMPGGGHLLGGDVAPEGVVAAPQGSLYMRNAGSGAGTTLYVKEGGASGNTGWVGK